MKSNEWIRQLVRRTFILISGIIAFFLVTTSLDVARRTLLIPSRTFLSTNDVVANILFWILFTNNIVWIIGSLLGLRALVQNPSLQQRIKENFLFQQPLLLQIVVFLEHGLSGTLYILLTGDERKGYILAWMLALHIVVALILAPRIVNVKSNPA